MTKNVLLVNPPYIKHTSGVKKVVSIHQPLGLAYLAASLEKEQIAVEILDANAEMLTINETVERVVKSDADFVGITATTATILITYRMSKEIKERCDKKIVAGGPHVSFVPKRTLEECEYIDIIVRGEGEKTMIDLVNNSETLQNVQGITFRDNNGNIICTRDRPLIENLDEIPFPARHLLPLDLYRPHILFNKGVKGKKYARVITSRGCPNKCIFCSASYFWKKLRLRSPENVISEIEHLVNEYGIQQLDFLDDTMTLSKGRIKKICKLLEERKIDIDWICYTRVNTITEDLVSMMKRAGCFGMCFGIESGNQAILNRIKKNVTLEQARKAVKITKKAGIKTMCDFMIGLPGDTIKTVNQTINFAIELNPDLAFFSITTPFPGTALFNEALSRGWIDENYSWDEMTMHRGTKFKTENLNKEDLEELYSKALKEFYLRPKFFANAAKRVLFNPYELKNYLKGVLYFKYVI